MKNFAKLFGILIGSLTLSGCIVAALGAGAAGGYYFEKHYKILKKEHQKRSSVKSNTKTNSATNSN